MSFYEQKVKFLKNKMHQCKDYFNYMFTCFYILGLSFTDKFLITMLEKLNTFITIQKPTRRFKDGVKVHLEKS